MKVDRHGMMPIRNPAASTMQTGTVRYIRNPAASTMQMRAAVTVIMAHTT